MGPRNRQAAHTLMQHDWSAGYTDKVRRPRIKLFCFWERASFAFLGCLLRLRFSWLFTGPSGQPLLAADLFTCVRMLQSLRLQESLLKRLNAFKEKEAVFGLCIFSRKIAFLVFVFSADRFALRLCIFRLLQKSRFFYFRLFLSLRRGGDQTDIPDRWTIFSDIVFQNRKVIHMFGLMNKRLRLCSPIKTRSFPYTDPMSVGTDPADHQISWTHGRGTAPGGREHSAYGTGPEKTCMREGGAGFSLLRRSDVCAHTRVSVSGQGQIKGQSRFRSSNAPGPGALPTHDPRTCASGGSGRRCW